MAEPATARPRIDRQFVDPQGRLTMASYALLSRLFDTPGAIDELVALVQSLVNEAQTGGASQESTRAVDELRNEVASTRNDVQGLRGLLDEMAAQMAGLRSVTDLRSRVQTIEDRLQ